MYNYKKLNNQPLKLALAEFRFSQVMQIAEHIPKVQEALRKKYPILEQKNEQSFHIQPGAVAISALNSWSFISANRKSAINVNQERLVYYAAEYSRFEDFSEACKQILDILVSIVAPSLVLRIGLRYGNLVEINEEEKISNLVDPHFGFSTSIEELGDVQHYGSETVITTSIGNLVIRTLYGKHNFTWLSDIQNLPIIVEKNEAPSERIILDVDHFWLSKNESINFETNEILEMLRLLHETSREAFWKVTTDFARNIKWA